LSAYNLFFKHERSRIVEGMLDVATPEDIINSVEGILATSRETRRHRKTHGRISFGDLARKIAEQWKCIQPEQKAVFDHYAEIDMRRYRKEVKIWKDKKEDEAFALSDHNPNGKMNGSISSGGSESEFSLDHFASSGGDAWGPRKANLSDSMNSSFSSTGSVNSDFGLEPLPIGPIGIMSGSNQMMGGLNPQPQLNMSMPTTISMGEPGGIGGDGGGGGMGGFDNSLSLSYAQQLQLQQVQLQQQHAQQFQQFQQQQQQLLAFQQNSMPMHNQHQQHPQMDPVPFEQVFPDERTGGGSSSKDLEDFLSNLDLSNI
jgi:hypothetical protein